MGADDFTDRERKLMSLAWQCFEGEPKVDYSKLARLSGMTNTGSAYNAWNKVKKKLLAHSKTAAGEAKSTKRTRSTAADEDDAGLAKKKARLGEVTEEDDEEVDNVKDTIAVAEGVNVKKEEAA